MLLLAIVLQQLVSRPVLVQHDGRPVAGAELTCGPSRATADIAGRASIAVPSEGCTLVVTKEGLAPLSTFLKPESAPVEVTLNEIPEIEEQVIVSATRSGRLASDQALRVEVVTREEIEEKLLMTPGDIVMLLNETSGIRLQATSPALGGASVRVQGLTGRYTPVLTDGLPINSTQVASLGLLQIPPMDLRQVEVIKGAASALYGASALGGVINLVTRLPTERHEREVLVNATSRRGADALLWLSGPAGGHGGYTFLGGVHGQNASDLDDDGWADLPRYRRVVLRPRFVRAGKTGGLELLAGFTRERRVGGTMASGDFVQAVETTRGDGAGVWRHITHETVIVARGSVSSIRHEHQYGAERYRDSHQAQFGEMSVSRALRGHSLVAGVAVERQAYDNAAFDVFDYAWTTPAVFAQDEWTVAPAWTLSLSGRLDWHPEYGTFASPRVSSLIRVRGFDVRLSLGRGFFAPTPLTEETDEVGLGRVAPPNSLRAERGTTTSLDTSRRVGFVDLSLSLFASRITDPLAVEPQGAELVLSNRQAPTRTSGAEVFARLRRGPFVVTASHVWTHASEVDADGRRVDVPLTPRRAAGLVAVWERHGVARVGIELYRTGTQRLEDNPYRSESRPYTIFGLLADRRVGRVRVFLNLENLTDVRQTNFDPLLLPAPALTGRRTVDAWAPLEGRTVNGGVRIGF